MPISSVQPGDKVLAFTSEGRTVPTKVRSILRTEADQYVILQTDRATLRVTEEHPFYLGAGIFKTLEALEPGDTIMAWDGRSLTEQMIVSLKKVQERVQVFNLQTDRPNTFFAGHIAVHNKGGGGGGGRGGGSFRSSGSSRSSSRSGAGGDDPGAVFVIVFLIVFIIVIVHVVRSKKGRKSENLDFVYDRKKIARKAEKTEKLLTFISQQDQALSPETLMTLAQSTFLKLQECWQARDYTPVKALLMPALFAQQQGQVLGMVRNHEINRLEDLKVKRVDLVHVRYTEKKDQREFTALITASARDTYVDDRTGEFLRGDARAARFQEFWTFHFVDDQWLLREIEQAGESDILKDENFAEMLTDETIQEFTGKPPKKELPVHGLQKEKKRRRLGSSAPQLPGADGQALEPAADAGTGETGVFKCIPGRESGILLRCLRRISSLMWLRICGSNPAVAIRRVEGGVPKPVCSQSGTHPCAKPHGFIQGRVYGKDGCPCAEDRSQGRSNVQRAKYVTPLRSTGPSVVWMTGGS